MIDEIQLYLLCNYNDMWLYKFDKQDKQQQKLLSFEINKDKLSINGADVQKDRNTTNKRQKAETAK